jgi:hypothetical protein
MIPYSELIKIVANGCRFQYESYDHKKALEEIKTEGVNIIFDVHNYFEKIDSCYGIPDHIKQKHIVWRTGKLRMIRFRPDGKMWKLYIGARRAKAFYVNDIGVSAKPMIFKSDDHLDLIGQGFAVQETL